MEIYLSTLWQLTVAMAPYILFGMFFAGLMHELIPERFITRHLGSDTIASTIKATLFGIPLPVCSCGVIPLATAIKRSGASNGATLAFLISTPITGIDSILATYGIFGLLFTLYRIASSILIAIVAGIITNLFGTDKTETSAVCFSAPDKSAATLRFSPAAPQTETNEESCCSKGSCCEGKEETRQGFSLHAALHYGFVTLLGDIAKPLFWGLLLGALITVAIPQNLSTFLQGHTWLSYLIVIAVALPMYVCATASLPIAAAMMLGGVSAGAAFVFLSAGPATNVVTVGVVKKILGKRALLIYLATIALGSILFGIGLDLLFDTLSIDTKALVHLDEKASTIATLSAALLWTMILYFIFKPYFSKKNNCCVSDNR